MAEHLITAVRLEEVDGATSVLPVRWARVARRPMFMYDGRAYMQSRQEADGTWVYRTTEARPDATPPGGDLVTLATATSRIGHARVLRTADGPPATLTVRGFQFRLRTRSNDFGQPEYLCDDEAACAAIRQQMRRGRDGTRMPVDARI